MRYFSVLAAALLAAGPAPASEWCDRADMSRLNAAERTICSNANLRLLDTNMAAAFHAKRNASFGAERDRLSTEQYRRWLPYRDICEADVDCLVVRYATRIAELTGSLDAAMLGGGGSAPDYTLTSEGYFERIDENGMVRVYNPANAYFGFRGPDGTITWYQPMTANPLSMPALPGGYENASRDLAARVSTLADLVLSDDQQTQLEPHEPADYFQLLDFYINAMVYVVGAAQ